MKRILVFALILCLVLPMFGCAWPGSSKESVSFYYQSRNYLHGKEGSVLVAEQRDASGHSTDLEYLMRLYLMGPYDEALLSPFPQDLRITDIRMGQDTVILSMTEQLSTLTGIQRSIACSCLALTCLDLTDAESVILMWENEIITMDRNSILLYDSST